MLQFGEVSFDLGIGRVTVTTPLRTGLVHAYVATLDAAAQGPLKGILRFPDPKPERLMDESVIDAFARHDPEWA